MSNAAATPEIQPTYADDPRWELVQRVASSRQFKTSARLHDFLLYVVGCALREAPEEATEQHIGIHVFQRSPGYNSSEDSIVRTHARLLRQKLREYFADEGSQEPTIIEIPKGHYLPVFRPADSRKMRPETPLEKTLPAFASPYSNSRPGILSSWPRPSGFKNRQYLYWVLTVCVLVAVAGAFFYRARTKRQVQAGHVQSGHVQSGSVSSGVAALWHPFFSSDPPLVIFSNAIFVGNSRTGMHYAKAADPDLTPDSYVDTYTGVGEVAAIYDLTRLFDSHRAKFILKRSLLVTWDEARLKNLIFIGSPAENPTLQVLPATTDFTMMSEPAFAGIVNHHPRPGEPAVYTRPEHPLTRDYAIIALRPGVQPGKWIFALSGLTTYGTQAAVEYVSRPDSIRTLLHDGVVQKGVIHPFEAVLETTVAGGVPIETRLVTIRVH